MRPSRSVSISEAGKPRLWGDLVSNERMADHLRVDRYGDFVLTDAIRPAAHLPVVPREGYRVEVYRDTAARVEVPALVASASREKLFSLFLSLLEPLGPVVDVILETSHESQAGQHVDLVREQIDLPVLMSYLYEFEDLVLNDGCTGIAVIAAGGPMEVQFDEHKLLVVYAQDIEPFEEILLQDGLRRIDRMRLLTEGEHLHSTGPDHLDQFDQLACRLGVTETAEQVRW
jgi:hypothetical protein